MAIAFSCACGRKINAKDEHAGKRVKCPGCQQPVTVPKAATATSAAAAAAAKPKAVAAAGGAKPGAPRTKPAAAAAKPAPVDDDMYDLREDAPASKPKRAGVAPASPWGDDDPGLDAPVAAPRPYMPGAGMPAAAPSRGMAPAAAAAGGAPAAGGAAGFAALGSKRGAPAATKKASGLHLSGFAKFLIGAAIILPTTFFIFKQGPVKAVAEWEKMEPQGEDDTRTLLMRVIHDMDAATMPPPDPDRDNRDGIPYHPQVAHFFYPDPPFFMWSLPERVYVQGHTTFGPYEGWYYTRDRRLECKMEWKNGDMVEVLGKCNPQGSVETLTIDGIASTDKMALSKKFDGYLTWSMPTATPKGTIGAANAAAAKGGKRPAAPAAAGGGDE
jgi:hypothetical protein